MKNYLVKKNEIVPFSILALITITLTIMMVYFGNWTIGDDAIYLRTTALGLFNWCKDGYLPEAERLFPLAHFDYNLTLLMPFLPVVKAHYLINAVSFIIYVFCLWLVFRSSIDDALCVSNINDNKSPHLYTIMLLIVALIFSKKLLLLASILLLAMHFLARYIHDCQYKPWLVLFAIISLILQPMWSVDFFELHTGTRLFVVLAIVFILLFKQYLNTHSIWYAIGALFVALYLTYGLEYHFGLFIVFAITLLLFYPNKTKQDICVLVSLMIIALSYLIVYMVTVFPYIETAYSHGEMESGFTKLLNWVKVYSLAILLGAYRCYQVLVKKDRTTIFYDACLATGLAGLIAMCYLKIFDPYSHIVNIVFCYVPVVYWTYRLGDARGSLILYVLLICGLISPYIHCVKERIHTMKATMPMIETIYEQQQQGKQITFCLPLRPLELNANKELTQMESYQMFKSRFEAIMRYYDPLHNFPKIKECDISDINLNDNSIVIFSAAWVDDIDFLKKIEKTKIRYTNYTGAFVYY